MTQRKRVLLVSQRLSISTLAFRCMTAWRVVSTFCSWVEIRWNSVCQWSGFAGAFMVWVHSEPRGKILTPRVFRECHFCRPRVSIPTSFGQLQLLKITQVVDFITPENQNLKFFSHSTDENIGPEHASNWEAVMCGRRFNFRFFQRG